MRGSQQLLKRLAIDGRSLALGGVGEVEFTYYIYIIYYTWFLMSGIYTFGGTRPRRITGSACNSR